MGLSIHGLRVYLCILECGSLSAAGRELGKTQPAISNHLHTLEEHFGVALLTRGRPLRATPAGECLAEHARRVLDGVSTLEAEMACHTAPHGPLMVGASSTPGELLMPGLVTEFSVRYPDVALELRIYDTEEAIAALLEREIETAVVGHEVDDPRLFGAVVGYDVLTPVVATSDRLAGAKVSPEELADRPFVLRERGSGTRQVAEEGLAAVGVNPSVAMELGSNAAVAGAVAAGAGVGVVPLRTMGTQGNIKRVEVRGLALSRPFVLLTEIGRALSPAAEAFVGTCTGKERL
ncbi:MAG: LysR family transcriptional regulator [Actinomycetota bacterium]|nr:LysR family transcriptional regulator [Actinomycetota bacterium]